MSLKPFGRTGLRIKKELPKEFFLVSEVRLECVVEFDAPGIVRIFAFISFGCEVVVSVEFDILLYSYACFSDPELHIGIVSIAQLIAHVQSGVADEHGAFVSLDIVSAERPRTDFVGIDFAVGETSGPMYGI